ncbi:MAG: hypothetical protein SFV81_15085 [Pirellulaceae bacterium]|nr:hypothetical protein [Pirellulaceae bacterium]
MFLRLTLVTILISAGAFTCAQESPVKSTNPEKPNPVEKPRVQETRGQDPERPQSERESREIFFRTLNETRSRGAQEFSYLLFQESVRKEIKLSDEAAKAARDVLSQTRVSAEKLYEQLKAKEITADELKVKMLEIMANSDRDIWKTLGESNPNSDRLIGLFVQHRHCASVLNKIVAEKVGLDETSRLKIIAKKEAVEREMFEERSRESQSPGDRFRAWEKVQKKIDAEVSAMLTPSQREKLEQLKGEPFKFEDFQLPPGRGREGGRDNGRDRNRRDNGHDEKCREADKLADDR